MSAMDQCVAAGANVINLSFGTNIDGYFLRTYIDGLTAQGIIVVASAGNNGDATKMYPASHPDVWSVAAVKANQDKLYWSNYNDQVEFAAPGHHVISTTAASSKVEGPSGFAYQAVPLRNTPKTSVAGKLVDCGDGTSCARSKLRNNVCLVVRRATSPATVKDIVKTCTDNGAIGAVIYSDIGGDPTKWGAYPGTTIPMVGVSKLDGLELHFGSDSIEMSTKNANFAAGQGLDSFVGEIVTIGDVGGNGIEYTYSQMSGTSMAAPHVAAVAGYLVSHVGDECTPDQIRYAMAATAEHPTVNEWGTRLKCDAKFGHGIVKAQQALSFLQNTFNCANTTIPAANLKGGCSLVGATPLY